MALAAASRSPRPPRAARCTWPRCCSWRCMPARRRRPASGPKTPTSAWWTVASARRSRDAACASWEQRWPSLLSPRWPLAPSAGRGATPGGGSASRRGRLSGPARVKLTCRVGAMLAAAASGASAHLLAQREQRNGQRHDEQELLDGVLDWVLALGRHFRRHLLPCALAARQRDGVEQHRHIVERQTQEVRAKHQLDCRGRVAQRQSGDGEPDAERRAQRDANGELADDEPRAVQGNVERHQLAYVDDAS